MTGERASRAYSIPKPEFLALTDSLRGRLRVMGPVSTGRDGSQTEFAQISSAAELSLAYQSTMIPPGKKAFYMPSEEILHFEGATGGHRPLFPSAFITSFVYPVDRVETLLIGVHPCDVHAILYLDRTFYNDPHYTASRAATVVVALNCTSVGDYCFCSSVGTGPHMKADAGYDLLLTDIGEDYLMEFGSERAGEIFGVDHKSAGDDEFGLKAAQETELIKRFKKFIDTGGLDALFLKYLEHPVWSQTADARCLSCANCVMVCPTCFCHDIVDEVDMDMKRAKRLRQWDACQDIGFAKVHGGNFRGERAARLRQFVMHKLNYTAQYGTLGTVGCGRCIQWCPTGIDLTEMAKEIQKTPQIKS